MSILAFGVVASVQALIRMNHNAALSRLQTGASTVVQNRIDEILNAGPFNPQSTPPQIPTVLALGTTTDGTEANPTVPVYTDPTAGTVVVRGWMTQQVVDASTVINGVTVPLYRATVTVNYKFRNNLYSVQMNTARASDR